MEYFSGVMSVSKISGLLCLIIHSCMQPSLTFAISTFAYDPNCAARLHRNKKWAEIYLREKSIKGSLFNSFIDFNFLIVLVNPE